MIEGAEGRVECAFYTATEESARARASASASTVGSLGQAISVIWRMWPGHRSAPFLRRCRPRQPRQSRESRERASSIRASSPRRYRRRGCYARGQRGQKARANYQRRRISPLGTRRAAPRRCPSRFLPPARQDEEPKAKAQRARHPRGPRGRCAPAFA